MDDSTVSWSIERYNSIQDQIGKYLKTIGYAGNDVIYLPMSGFTGQNLKVAVDDTTCPWFKGDTLLNTLDSLQPLERMDEMLLRIPLLDRYRESGKTVLMGKVETGVLKVGDEIVVNPNNIKMTAIQIQNDEFIISVAKPGENVKIIVKCSATDEEYISKGSVVSHVNSPCVVTSDIVAQIFILEIPETKRIFTAAYQLVLHVGTVEQEAKVARLLDQLDKQGKSVKKNPNFVLEKTFVIAHLTISKPICIESYNDFQQLGRFTIRDEGRTIGFGKILATNAPVAVKRVKNNLEILFQ